jgi:hypothetical protein
MAVVYEDDGAELFQAVVASAGEPLAHALALDVGARIRHRAERIIDQQDVGAASHDGAADPRSEVRATVLCRPSAARLCVFGKPRVKHVRVFL